MHGFISLKNYDVKFKLSQKNEHFRRYSEPSEIKFNYQRKEALVVIKEIYLSRHRAGKKKKLRVLKKPGRTQKRSL